MSEKRIVNTKFVIDNPVIRGGQLFGVKAILDFTVSGNMEEKELGEFIQISNVTVDFNGATFQNVLADAMAQRKVKWQGPMRDNMDKIETLSNSTVRFEDVPFSKARVVTKPMTLESATEYIKGLPPEEQQKAIADLLATIQANTQPTDDDGNFVTCGNCDTEYDADEFDECPHCKETE